MTLGSSVLGRPPFSAGICRIKDLAEFARRVSPRGRPSSAVTVDVSDIRRGIFRSFTFCKIMRGAVIKLTPGFCQCEPARCAIEQARSEFPFDPADCHCRFRQPQFVRGADKGARLNDLGEDRQALEIRELRHVKFHNYGR